MENQFDAIVFGAGNGGPAAAKGHLLQFPSEDLVIELPFVKR